MERHHIGGNNPPPVQQTPQEQPRHLPPPTLDQQISVMTYKQCLELQALLEARKLEAREEAISQALDLMGPGASVSFEGKHYTLNEKGKVTSCD